MKIALRSPNWIGDCIMALPAIKSAAFHFKDAEIHIVTKSYLTDFFLGLDYISSVIPIPDKMSAKDYLTTAKTLRSYRFSKGILLTNSFSSALLFKMGGIGDLNGYGRDLRSLLLKKSVRYTPNDRHHRHYYSDLIASICGKESGDIRDGQLTFEERETEDTKNKLNRFGIQYDKPIIGFSTTAAFGPAKAWPPERFKALISTLIAWNPELQIVLLGTKKEKAVVSDIVDNPGNNVFNLAGELSLREALVTVSLCRFFLCNDSGMMHVADNLNIPLISIFGPTEPHKTSPISDSSTVMFNKADCSPCKHRICPIDHRCMTSIDVESVFETLKEKMG